MWGRAAVLGILGALLAGTAAAQVVRAAVEVQGMSCPFCAFGVEKRLRRVGGVAAVEVAMAKGTATMTAAEGGSIDVAAIPEAVRRSGFTPGPVEIVVRGTVRNDPAGEGPPRRLLAVSGSGEELLLVDLSEEQRREIEALAGTGAEVHVEGDVHFHPDDLPALAPTVIEKVDR